jgi:glucose-6-phosphate dehydrogenase assembly protein OpcA
VKEGNGMARMGERALVGWRATMADAVAGPVSRRTPISRPGVRAVVGWAFVALAILYLGRVARRMT